jgi:hypothetical protein
MLRSPFASSASLQHSQSLPRPSRSPDRHGLQSSTPSILMIPAPAVRCSPYARTIMAS